MIYYRIIKKELTHFLHISFFFVPLQAETNCKKTNIN